MSADANTVSLLNRSEIDMQIATAHKYPRSITRFRKEVYELVTLSERVADECFYALPRDGKMVEGPSARFAEIVASCWGNSRAGARVVSDQGDFITAQGVFHDLERNVAITYEVQRRITNRSGTRFSADMIGVTGNAASSIALRNAILKGVPKAFWVAMYEDARKTAVGDVATLPTRRAKVFDALLKMGVTAEQVFAKLALGGMDDIGLDQLQLLKGMMTAIREGDTTIEQAFALDGAAPAKRPAAWDADAFAKRLPKWQDAINAGQAHDAIVAFAKSKGALSAEQEAAIRALKKAAPPAEVVDASTGEVVTAGEPTWGDNSMESGK